MRMRMRTDRQEKRRKRSQQQHIAMDGVQVGMYVRVKTVQLKSGKRSLYGSGPCRPYEDISFSAYRSYL